MGRDGAATARAPVEVLYLLPVAVVVGVVAMTGNPMIGRAVVYIVVAGLVTAWLSGVLLELSRRRILVHLVVTAIAVLAIVYLVVDHLRLLDLLEETWRTGPAVR
ncbi:MAG: hypothetical protein WKG01_17485 [Kofleriaceae bacterium]